MSSGRGRCLNEQGGAPPCRSPESADERDKQPGGNMAIEVVAQTRKGQGRGASRRLRHSGKVPGILYGGKKPAVTIELDHNPLYHQLRNEKFHASVLTLALD